MISVIICTFNHGEYIKRSIDSVLSQTYKDYELIVVDDCSTDNTEEILSSYKDKFKLIKNSKNMNLMASRKIGFDNSKGDYIIFIDADDYFTDKNVLEQYSTKFGFDIVCSLNTATNPAAGFTSNSVIYRNDLYFGKLIRELASKNSFIWNKMFSRDLVNTVYSKIEITDSFMNEDTVFVNTAWNNANSYGFLNYITYFYSLGTGYSKNLNKLISYGGRRGNYNLQTVKVEV